MVEKEDMLIFRLREQKRQAQPAALRPPPAQALNKGISEDRKPAKQATSKLHKEAQKMQQPQEEPEPEFMIPTTPQYAVEEAERLTTGGAKSRFEMKSRDAALGQRCEWHPWRAAYAVCETCHKPYCYEDISEYNGKYYCLEDIDAATRASRNSIFVYNRLGDVSAVMLIIVLPIFVYFTSGLLSYILASALKEGINSFIYGNFVTHLNYSYLLLFGGLILAITEFISGILIVGQSNKGYALGLASAFLSIALFNYSYLINSTLYSMIVAVVSFVGMLLLAYSKNSILASQQESQAALPADAMQYSWPNLGRF